MLVLQAAREVSQPRPQKRRQRERRRAHASDQQARPGGALDFLQLTSHLLPTPHLLPSRTGKARRLAINADLPELWITLLGHPALELLEECRGKGWSDDSAETVAAFKRGVLLEAGGPRVDLFSFDGCLEGGQLAWAADFDPDAKLNRECVLVGANTGGKRDATKAVLKLGKPHVTRLGLLGLCSGTSVSCPLGQAWVRPGPAAWARPGS